VHPGEPCGRAIGEHQGRYRLPLTAGLGLPPFRLHDVPGDPGTVQNLARRGPCRKRTDAVALLGGVLPVDLVVQGVREVAGVVHQGNHELGFHARPAVDDVAVLQQHQRRHVQPHGGVDGNEAVFWLAPIDFRHKGRLAQCRRISPSLIQSGRRQAPAGHSQGGFLLLVDGGRAAISIGLFVRHDCSPVYAVFFLALWMRKVRCVPCDTISAYRSGCRSLSVARSTLGLDRCSR